MKLILFICFCVTIACSEPRHITFNPDDHAATSGTVGSSKASTQLPAATMDTSSRRDTTIKRKNLP